MEMKTFIDVLEALEKESSTNNKIDILKENKDVEYLQQYLQITLDKRYTYGVKKLVQPATGEFYKYECSYWDAFEEIINFLKAGKLTGNAAQLSIHNFLSQVTELEKKWYTKAILKDLASVGMGVGVVNKSIPGCVYDYDCMLAMQETKMDKATYPARVPLKYDGVRGQVFINKNGKVFSLGWEGLKLPIARSGLPFYQLDFMVPYIEEAVRHMTMLRNVVLDGEFHVNHSLSDAQSVTQFEEKTEEDFRGKSGKISKGWQDYFDRKAEIDKLKEDMKFVVFEVLTMDEWNTQTCTRTDEERCNFVKAVLGWSILNSTAAHKIDIEEYEIANSEAEARAIASKNMDNGYEGAIVKPLTGVYEWKRSYSWIKIKEEVETDVLITGVIIGETKYHGDGTSKPDMMGKFTVTDGTRIFEVGTGKSWGETFRTEVWNSPEEYIGRVMKITAQKFTEDSVIQPRFNSWRSDKCREDILGKN